MKTFNNIEDFCRFVRDYRGDLTIKGCVAYSDNGVIVAILVF